MEKTYLQMVKQLNQQPGSIWGAENILDDKNCSHDIAIDVFINDKHKVRMLAQQQKEMKQTLEKVSK